MKAFAPPPPEAQPEPNRPGSRLETCRILVLFAADLISVPFHLLTFLMTRTAHRRRFRQALEEGAAGTHVSKPRAETPRS
jgi:hypothetical protein